MSKGNQAQRASEKARGASHDAQAPAASGPSTTNLPLPTPAGTEPSQAERSGGLWFVGIIVGLILVAILAEALAGG